MEPLSIEYLKQFSGLPGPRGNLELLHEFGAQCDPRRVQECLEILRDDTANSPEEFVGMCGVLGYSLLNWNDPRILIPHWERYARHRSWRIREAVAIAIQEVPCGGLVPRLDLVDQLGTTDAYVWRAVVAGLCDPKNLKGPGMERVFSKLETATESLDHDWKLDDGKKALRKALGYGWSVAIVADPGRGKPKFEALLDRKGKHVAWIIAENLKKHRLTKMDAPWVNQCKTRIPSSPDQEARARRKRKNP